MAEDLLCYYCSLMGKHHIIISFPQFFCIFSCLGCDLFNLPNGNICNISIHDIMTCSPISKDRPGFAGLERQILAQQTVNVPANTKNLGTCHDKLKTIGKHHIDFPTPGLEFAMSSHQLLDWFEGKFTRNPFPSNQYIEFRDSTVRFSPKRGIMHH